MMDSATQTYDDPEPGLGSGPGGCRPCVENDTSTPFGSVKEAVIRFGGRGFRDNSKEFDICKLEEQASEMLKDLNTKQQETRDILKDLGLTKTLIEELKLRLHEETSEFVVVAPSDDRISSLDCSTFALPLPAVSVMVESTQAKQNLSQNSNELESIRAFSENKKMEKTNNSDVELSTKLKLDTMKEASNGSPVGISRELKELNLEAEQFTKAAEAAKAEVLKAMCEIEETKAGLKMIEMRWVAAKKLEEAAKATEALALAEINTLSSSSKTPRKDDEMWLKEFMSRVGVANDPRYELDLFDEWGPGIGPSRPILRPSIGDALSRKLVLRDGIDVGRQRVSLSQMLNRDRAESPPPMRNDVGGLKGGFFSKRKNLGFVHISLPMSKQSRIESRKA